jgi:DNA-binding transcriptional regulator YhcF (GntR family)
MAQHKNSVYGKISEDISAKIKSGEYVVGSLLEPERKLMEKYGVERTTVRRALELLVKEGLIVKKAGLGTFISDGKSIPDDKKAVSVKPVKKITRKVLPENVKLCFNFASAASQIFECLKDNGHQKVMCIMKNTSKYGAICGEAVKHGMYDKDLFILAGKNKTDDAFVMMWRSLRSPKPTALIVEDENDAKLILTTTGRMRITVPTELSLIAFEKDEACDIAGCVCDKSAEKKLIKMLENVPDEEIYPMTVLADMKFDAVNSVVSVKKDSLGSGSMSSFLL